MRSLLSKLISRVLIVAAAMKSVTFAQRRSGRTAIVILKRFLSPHHSSARPAHQLPMDYPARSLNRGCFLTNQLCVINSFAAHGCPQKRALTLIKLLRVSDDNRRTSSLLKLSVNLKEEKDQLNVYCENKTFPSKC